MPFIPLSTRRRQEVTLGDRESFEVSLHKPQTWYAPGAQAGTSETQYRYARHPATLSRNLGAQVPFADYHSTWRPPSAESQGPAAQRVNVVADYGGLWEGAHSMKIPRSRSSPSLAATDKAFADKLSEQRHPIYEELTRYHKMATQQEMEMAKSSGAATKYGTISKSYKDFPHVEIPSGPSGALVNFPKYLLFNDCHLKQTDIKRYVAEEAAAREVALRRSSSSSVGALSDLADSSGPSGKSASLRARAAGSPMPGGKGVKTSNPFRN